MGPIGFAPTPPHFQARVRPQRVRLSNHSYSTLPTASKAATSPLGHSPAPFLTTFRSDFFAICLVYCHPAPAYNAYVTYTTALAIFRFPSGARPGLRAIAGRYRELAKRFHPDAGGSQDDMVRLNAAKDVLEEMLQSRQADSGHTHSMDEYYKTGQPDETYPDWEKREQRYVKNITRPRSRKGSAEFPGSS